MFEQRLAALDATTLLNLKDIKRGLEKESLRIDSNGYLSQKPHPKMLGSALTHPFITTDYSEALVEFITPTFTNYAEPIQFLEKLHQISYIQLEKLNEKLWVNSMPCALTAEEDIPIANYGTSNTGKTKSIYRVGLGHRYGKTMQTIAGLHYNMSFPETFLIALHQQQAPEKNYQAFVNDAYFSLIRNVHRYSWLLIYLFGASPAVCKSFFKEIPAHLDILKKHTVVAPYGTSLRMSDLGYQNSAQAQIKVRYDHLSHYVADLCDAVDTPYPPFEAIGLKEGKEWKQLNTHILQIENEYYGVIRPKRTAQKNERPLSALKNRGVEYIELRCLDLNPFIPAGITQEQFHFLDLFCCYCLLENSPIIENDECARIQQTFQQVAQRGRQPELMLPQAQGHASLKEIALALCDKLNLLAQKMDSAQATQIFSHAVHDQRRKIENPEATPSAHVIAQLNSKDQCFFEFAMQCAKTTETYFHQSTPSHEEIQYFHELAKKSLEEQTKLESNDDLSFEEHLAHYFRTC